MGDASCLQCRVSGAGDPGAEEVPISEIERVLTIKKGQEFNVCQGEMDSESWTRSLSSQITKNLEFSL
jgi:hypothetical protein